MAVTAVSAAQGVLNILEAVRSAGLSNDTRVYQASTSELYGKVAEVPQSETTPFYPRSPYAVSKLFGFWIVKNYRYSKLFARECIATGAKMFDSMLQVSTTVQKMWHKCAVQGGI